MERRTLQNERKIHIEKRADGGSTLVGYAAVFYDGTSGTQYSLWPGMVERVMPGAFDRAIAEDDVRGLFNHDESDILGRNRAGTMRLSVDAVGLRYEIDCPPTDDAASIVTSIERGDVTGSSFSFEVITQTWINETTADGIEIEVRQLQDVRLYDVGPVTFPAYAGTSVGVRISGDTQEARAAYDACKSQLAKELIARDNRLRDIRLDEIHSES